MDKRTENTIGGAMIALMVASGALLVLSFAVRVLTFVFGVVLPTFKLALFWICLGSLLVFACSVVALIVFLVRVCSSPPVPRPFGKVRKHDKEKES